MPEFADIYVAVKTRSRQAAIDFLDHFLPQRVESTDEYEFPQYTLETETEFASVADLMHFLEMEKQATYNLYWRNTDETNPNKHGMLFYTSDEAVIFGISRNAEIGGHLNTTLEDECLALMKAFFQTDLGYITYEDTPAETYEAFVEVVKRLL